MEVVRYIKVEDSVRKEIEAQVGCTYNHAYKSLRYQGDGEMSRQVRDIALARGGVHRIDAPQSQAIVRGTSGWDLMLDNGVCVRFVFEGEGKVMLERDSKSIAVYPNPDVSSIGRIIEYAANL